MMRDAAFVAFGGALGSVSRYLVTSLVGRSVLLSQFPWGTWVVNIAGCLMIGLLCGIGARATQPLSPEMRLLCITGFLGGFTTFSSFSLESWALISRSEYVAAFLNVLSQCVVGLTAVALGFWLARTSS